MRTASMAGSAAAALACVECALDDAQYDVAERGEEGDAYLAHARPCAAGRGWGPRAAHALDLLARAVGRAGVEHQVLDVPPRDLVPGAREVPGVGRAALHGRAHAVVVVLGDEDAREVPQLGLALPLVQLQEKRRSAGTPGGGKRKRGRARARRARGRRAAAKFSDCVDPANGVILALVKELSARGVTGLRRALCRRRAAGSIGRACCIGHLVRFLCPAHLLRPVRTLLLLAGGTLACSASTAPAQRPYNTAPPAPAPQSPRSASQDPEVPHHLVHIVIGDDEGERGEERGPPTLHDDAHDAKLCR
ncbi:hypothetical protein B0H11DRAFT_1939742 [Mycena galericulata]|nr:hypothetical protein B0H11DRAFT_1939742 [Mycena galericulata]